MLQGGFRAAREGKSVQVPGAVPAGDTARPGLNLNLDSEVGTDSFRVCFHLTRETCASIYDGGLGFLRERPGGPSRSVGPTFATGGLLLQGTRVRSLDSGSARRPTFATGGLLLQGGEKDH